MAKTKCRAKITEDMHAELRGLYLKGLELKQMAAHFGVGQSSVTRALKRARLPTIRERDNPGQSAGQLPPKREEWKHCIDDDPETLTAALCGDPTPKRRQLMAEGLI